MRWGTGQRSCDGRQHYKTQRVDGDRVKNDPAVDSIGKQQTHLHRIQHEYLWIYTHTAVTQFDIFVPFPLCWSECFQQRLWRTTSKAFTFLSSEQRFFF